MARPARRRFESILFDSAIAAPDAVQPDYFSDLNLDQVLEALTAGRERYELEPFFCAPLHEVAAVRYRHEALRDIQQPAVRASITAFAAAMNRMREQFTYVRELRHPLQKQAWFLDAAQEYCRAIGSLSQRLGGHDLSSTALRGLRDHVAAYAAGQEFGSLAADANAVKQALAGVRYSVRVQGAKVTVTRYEGEPDYSAEIEKTFARFKQGAVKTYLTKITDLAEMDHVEAQILDRVARLHTDEFAALQDFCARRRDFQDPTIARFDREVQFYLAYLDVIAPLQDAGLAFCYPEVSEDFEAIAAEDTFDIALARKLVVEGAPVVGNDFQLDPPERVLVVTGPNNGGKTTFARTFGQLHHLAGLGLPVPGSRARLTLPDAIYTHFEREEDIETLRGKFEDELLRVKDLLERATERSVIVMNESFSSTTLSDALLVGREITNRILELGACGVYVTFVDEIASLGDATVSMVAQIVPENPAERTFKVIRTPADGLAYAWAIAEKYGLSYDRLMQRIAA